MPRNKFWLVSTIILSLTSVGNAQETFHPFWTGQAFYSYSGLSVGQRGSLLTLAGWEHLNPQGSFFQAEVLGGTQLMENTMAAFGAIQMGGGVGLGDLTPSLEVEIGHGDLDFNDIQVLINIEKQLSADWALNIFLTGEVTSHDGPLGALIGQPAGSTAEIDDLDAWGGAALKWNAASPLLWTLTYQFESDETVKVQDLAHVNFNEVDCAEYVNTLSLEAGLAVWNHCQVSLAGQFGLDSTPAGTFYSKLLGQTLTQSKAQTSTFSGASVSLAYDF
jgi:hypothetical protein